MSPIQKQIHIFYTDESWDKTTQNSATQYKNGPHDPKKGGGIQHI